LTFHDAAFQSDHRPVCAGFRLDTNMPYVALLDQVAHTSTLEAVLNAHVDTNLLRALLFDE
jgi:hypothetical protein